MLAVIETYTADLRYKNSRCMERSLKRNNYEIALYVPMHINNSLTKLPSVPYSESTCTVDNILKYGVRLDTECYDSS